MTSWTRSPEQKAKNAKAHANRSAGQQRRLDREFADGYLAYLRGQLAAGAIPISGASPIDTGAYITVADAVKRLGLSRSRIYQLLAAGRLDAVQVGDVHKVWLLNGDNLTIKPPARDAIRYLRFRYDDSGGRSEE